MLNINFADDWFRSADLWYWKQPLYQLSHNHSPLLVPLSQTIHACQGRKVR